MGDLELMRPGIIDMLGVFFLKVPITKVLFFFWRKTRSRFKTPYNIQLLAVFITSIVNFHVLWVSCNLFRLLLMSLSLRAQTRDLKLTGKVYTASSYSLKMRGKQV